MPLKNSSRLYQQSTVLHTLVNSFKAAFCPVPSRVCSQLSLHLKANSEFHGTLLRAKLFYSFKCFKNLCKSKNYVPKCLFCHLTDTSWICLLFKDKKNPLPKHNYQCQPFTWCLSYTTSESTPSLRLGFINTGECLLANIYLGTDPWNKSNSSSYWFEQHFSS